MHTSSQFGVHILPREVTKHGRRQVDVCNCVKTEDMQLYRPAAVELEGHWVQRIAPTRPLCRTAVPIEQPLGNTYPPTRVWLYH